MFQSPMNNVIVTVKTKYIENFLNVLKGAAINHGSMLNQADYVNIIGTVVSVPKAISQKRDYVGYSASDIRVGDTVIFSHAVIYDFLQLEPEAEPIYKNMIWYRGKEYFAADIQHIYAVVRDEQIRMQNGYLMLEDMQKPPLIILSKSTRRLISSAQATLKCIGRPLTTEHNIDVVPGDTVFYNPAKLRIYQVKGKTFGILRQRDVLGREVVPYKKLSQIN